MKQVSFFHLLFWLLWAQQISADPIITFYFRNYSPNNNAQTLINKIKKPYAIAKHTLTGILHHNPISGIFSTYFGFLNASDHNGQTMYPRKQSKTLLHLVITNKITPITMFQYTISHWELVPGIPAKMYRCEQKEDPETKLVFWDIQEESLPDNNQIPMQDALIIIAKPHSIVVPMGITLTKPSANLLLPDMYVKRGIQTNRNALYVLDLALFFRPVNILYKKAKTSYETLVSE